MNQPQISDSQLGPVGHNKIEGTLDTPAFACDLSREIQNLHKEEAWVRGMGPSSKTLVKFSDLRLVLIAMKGKMCMHEHRTAARISIQTLAGRIRLRLRDRTVYLPAGQLLVLDHCVLHDVESDEDSAFLLTLSWPAEEAGRCVPDQAKND